MNHRQEETPETFFGCPIERLFAFRAKRMQARLRLRLLETLRRLRLEVQMRPLANGRRIYSGSGKPRPGSFRN